MSATAYSEVEAPCCKSPSYQPVWAVQDSRVTSKHLKDYGARFSEKIQFAEEQPITSKAKSPPRISRLPDVFRGQSLCYRVSKKFASLQILKRVRGVLLMFG